MNFAEKLSMLRKENGWSQEKLAEHMSITRQSVQKWESGQSVPDVEKLVKLSELFGVSTDYLLKDDLNEQQSNEASYTNINTNEYSREKTVTIKEAEDFLSVKASTSKHISLAVFLCIISPICLIILGALSETQKYGITENLAAGIGMTVLLIIIAVAVAIFIKTGMKTSAYSYLEKQIFSIDTDVKEMVNRQKEQYKNTCAKSTCIGTCICILSLIPLFVGVIINEDDDMIMTLMFSITLLIIAIGVTFFINSGIIWESYKKLLAVEEYSNTKKKTKPITDTISTIWWLTSTAIYLAYSLITDNWEYSWIIWPISAILYPGVMAIINLRLQKSPN